jgi:histidine ammonia-lyase
MGWTSMRKLHEVMSNVRVAIAIELLLAAQALDFREDIAEPGPATGAVRDRIRRDVPRMDTDRHVGDQITAVEAMLADIVDTARDAVGSLN